MDKKWLLACTCLSLLVSSCAKKESIQVGGSSTVLPVVAQVADEFRSLHPDVNLIVNAGGSGVAINQLGSGRLQVGMISRQLSDEERARYPQIEFVSHVIGRDAVVPVVSAAVYEEGVRKLSVEELRAIYAGRITNWAEVGGPDRDMLVIDKERSRGTRHIFMQVIAGHPEADAPGADLVLGANNELQTAITQSNSAIGMLSHAWLNEDVKGLAVVTAGGEQIAPTLENIHSGRYPIVRNIELLTNGRPSGQVREFIDFVLGERGQQIVEGYGYARVGE